nr:XopAX family type III secretion system effector [Janthinobacterium sp. Marseille]
MRITDDCSPEAMLAELFREDQHTKEDTAIFASVDWSNHNYVCNAIKQRVDVMLRSYERLGNEVHVTQSMRDNGVDIILEFSGESVLNRRIGIQVKSNREAIKATGKKKERTTEPMEAVLKRQAFDSHKWKLDEWWIILCFDLTQKSHVDLVNRINSELLQSPPIQIRIYEPMAAWSMLSMSHSDIDAICVCRLCREDEILIAAQDETIDLSPIAYQIVMATLFDSLQGNTQHSLSDLVRMTNDNGEYDLDRVSDILGELDDYLVSSEEDSWFSRAHKYPGLCALYYEGRIRHKLSHDGAANFVRQLA